MARDELRADPFAWALVKNHIRETPRIQKRSRRRRRAVQLSVTIVGAVLLSLFAASALRAGPDLVVGLELFADGSGTIEVFGNASSEEVADQLAAVLDGSRFQGRVWVTTKVGRPVVEGRLLHDGEGMDLLDQDPNFDNTASRIRLEPDAVGPIIVLRQSEGGEGPGQGYELGCALAGMTWAEADRVASELGYELRLVDEYTPEELKTRYVEDVLTIGIDAPTWLVPSKVEADLVVQRCVDQGRTVGLGDNPRPSQ